jgi:hypothetical protein
MALMVKLQPGISHTYERSRVRTRDTTDMSWDLWIQRVPIKEYQISYQISNIKGKKYFHSVYLHYSIPTLGYQLSHNAFTLKIITGKFP